MDTSVEVQGNVEEDAVPALHRAVVNKDAEFIKQLKDVDLLSRDHEGHTPLHLACMADDEHMASLVFKKKALEARDNYGKTPLHYVAALNNGFHVSGSKGPSLVKLLMEKLNGDDIQIKIRDQNGRTPIDIAKALHCSNTVDILVEASKEIKLKAKAHHKFYFPISRLKNLARHARATARDLGVYWPENKMSDLDSECLISEPVVRHISKMLWEIKALQYSAEDSEDPKGQFTKLKGHLKLAKLGGYLNALLQVYQVGDDINGTLASKCTGRRDRNFESRQDYNREHADEHTTSDAFTAWKGCSFEGFQLYEHRMTEDCVKYDRVFYIIYTTELMNRPTVFPLSIGDHATVYGEVQGRSSFNFRPSFEFYKLLYSERQLFNQKMSTLSRMYSGRSSDYTLFHQHSDLILEIIQATSAERDELWEVGSLDVYTTECIVLSNLFDSMALYLYMILVSHAVFLYHFPPDCLGLHILTHTFMQQADYYMKAIFGSLKGLLSEEWSDGMAPETKNFPKKQYTLRPAYLKSSTAWETKEEAYAHMKCEKEMGKLQRLLRHSQRKNKVEENWT